MSHPVGGTNNEGIERVLGVQAGACLRAVHVLPVPHLAALPHLVDALRTGREIGTVYHENH